MENLDNIKTLNTFRREYILSKVYKVIIIALLIFILLMVFVPLIFVINTSFKSYSDYVLKPTEINIFKWQISNYVSVIKTSNLVRSTINSFIVTGFAVICSVVNTALVSFAVGTLKFKGSKLVYFFALCSMFISGDITLIPTYILYAKLNLIGKFGALLLPSVLGVPGFGILVGASYIKSIPAEIHEAAIMDGASAPQLFFRIDLPMMKPILALTAVLTFQGNWGNFMWPYVSVLANKEAHTMALTLITSFSSNDGSMVGQLSAALVLMSIPIVVVYSFFSKAFIEGMAAGSVKG